MRVLFVFSLNDIQSPARPLRTPEMIQLGISYISAVLRKHGHPTRLIVLSRMAGKHNQEIIGETMREFEPGVVCFYAVSSEYDFIREMAREIRRARSGVKLVIGGPHATLDPEGTIKDFDVACVGEGEYPVLEYVTKLEKGEEPGGIANLWIRRGGDVERNETRPFLEKVDELPFPDRQMWGRWIEEEPNARPVVMLGRGCPFRCTYCCHHLFKKLAAGAYVRFRSPENIVAEIREIEERWPHYREIHLEQETIGTNPKWAAALCDELAEFNKTRTMPLTFGVNLAVTPNIDYETLFANLKRANVRYVNMDLESGSERLRQEVLRRKYSNEDIIRAARTARKHGLQVALFNIIGLPTETVEDFHKTVEVNRKCEPNWHCTSIFYPYPGTDLYRMCMEKGLLNRPKPIAIEDRSEAALDLPGFSRKQIQTSYEWFDYYVYRGRRPLLKLWAKVLRGKMKRMSLC